MPERRTNFSKIRLKTPRRKKTSRNRSFLMPSKRRIGILTGGGDVPGLNVAIKAVVMRAQNHDIEAVGLRRGWASLLNLNPDDPTTTEKWLMPLTPHRVRAHHSTGG